MGPRSQVAVPAQGMEDLRATLDDLVAQYYTGDEGQEGGVIYRVVQKLPSPLQLSMGRGLS